MFNKIRDAARKKAPKRKKSKAERAYNDMRSGNERQAKEIWQECVDQLFELGWTPAALMRPMAPNVVSCALSLEPIKYKSWVDLKQKIAERATGRVSEDAGETEEVEETEK